MMKKIVFFVGSMNWGGAEKVVSILANDYAKNGWDVAIVSLLSTESKYILEKNIKLIHIVRNKRKYLYNVFFWIKGIRKFLTSYKPDIIVSFVCRINILVLLAKILSKNKSRTIISERNDPEFDGRGKIALFLANTLYPKSDLLICQSSKEKEFFNKKIQRKTVVIKNPIELFSRPVPFEEKRPIIINAARLDSSKNQEMLIRVFSRIVSENKNKDYRLIIYGTGPLKEKLQSIVHDLNSSDFITIMDSTLEIHKKMAEASIFCLTSKYEGMSNSLMEALALGTPSISTMVSGSNDLIIDGVNGFLIRIGDSEALYEKIVFLIQNDDCRQKFYNYCLSDSYQKDLFSSLDKYRHYIDGEIK